MKRISLSGMTLLICIMILSASVFAQQFGHKEIVLKTTGYAMDINVDFEKEMLYNSCRITVSNPTNSPVQHVPLLLYRLMKVSSVTDRNGSPLPFSQQVFSFEDWQEMQANYIDVVLKEPLRKGEQTEIKIEYSGFLKGYTETGMLYVRDHISPDFTIIRMDSFAYPRVGYPSWQVNRRAGPQAYDYHIKVTVPDSLVAANGGLLVNKHTDNNRTTYEYRNIKKAWRMDIAISNYQVIEDGKFRIYYFPEDAANAENIYTAMNKTLALYTNWFGELIDFQGFSVIEIPDGCGSQADVTAIIQTAGPFKNDERMYAFYHEISHFWNVKDTDAFPPRWNEGLAVFLQYLTVEELEKREIMHQATESTYARVQANYKKNPHFRDLAFIDFGKEGATDLSYRVGMIFFQILHKMIGAEEFNNIIDTYYHRYHDTGITAAEFFTHIKDNTTRDVSLLIEEWIYSSKYSEYIINNVGVEELVQKYSRDN